MALARASVSGVITAPALSCVPSIPSVSAPGYPESTHGPLLAAYEAVAELFREAGKVLLHPGALGLHVAGRVVA